MQSFKTTFTRAAGGFARSRPGLTVIWLMVMAIVILDECKQIEKDRERKRGEKRPPAPTP